MLPRRIKIERYEPVVIADKTDQKPIETVITEKPAVDFQSIIIDHLVKLSVV